MKAFPAEGRMLTTTDRQSDQKIGFQFHYL